VVSFIQLNFMKPKIIILNIEEIEIELEKY
jgi:hypothetical protein